MQINKIKIKSKAVEILYNLPPASTETKEVKLSCDEEARREFYDAMNALLIDVIGICGLDGEIWEQGKVIGITLKHSEDGDGYGCVVTAQNTIGEKAVVINTPFVDEIEEEMEARVEEAIAQAEKYIAGERAQMSLFDSEVAA